MTRNSDNHVTAHSRPLWAPWRIGYIRSPKDGECFLCMKAAADADVGNHVIFRGDTSFVLLNDFPYNSGHLLVAPYRHVGDLSLLETDEQNELMQLLVRSQEVLTKVMRPEGFNVGFNLGPAGGAGLADHVHGHVVPRWVGDTNFMPVLADVRCIPEALDETASLLRDAWS